MSLTDWVRRRMLKEMAREPDLIIKRPEGTYNNRWWIIPRNPFFNIYLHLFHLSDESFAHHDHPWLFNLSWILSEGYLEHMGRLVYCRAVGDIVFRWGAAPHRIELFSGRFGPVPCISLFITGPVVRDWGFLCRGGWKSHKDLVALEDGVARMKEEDCV